MTVRSLVLIAVMLTHQLHSKEARRTSTDTDSSTGKYQYVVALINDYRRCTGTLISPNWVVTAAHCIETATHIQYGNMSIPFGETETHRKVMLTERPPASKILEPDLGLIYVNSVPMNEYGQLSAVDYKTLAGRVIEYAGFGLSKTEPAKVNEGVVKEDQLHPLQLKEGVVSLCNEDEKSAFSPYLCVAPKCSDRKKHTPPGEPGSPLFHAGKLAGVHVGATLSSIRSYTPISPYLSWIQRVMNKEQAISRSHMLKTYIPSEYEYRRFLDLTRYLDSLRSRLAGYKEEVMSPLLQEKYQKRDAEDPGKK